MAQPPSAHIATVTSLHKTVTNSSALNQIDVSLYYMVWVFGSSIYSSNNCFPVISLTGNIISPDSYRRTIPSSTLLARFLMHVNQPLTFAMIQLVDFLSVLIAQTKPLADHCFLVFWDDSWNISIFSKCILAIVHYTFVIIWFTEGGSQITRILLKVMCMLQKR